MSHRAIIKDVEVQSFTDKYVDVFLVRRDMVDPVKMAKSLAYMHRTQPYGMKGIRMNSPQSHAIGMRNGNIQQGKTSRIFSRSLDRIRTT